MDSISTNQNDHFLNDCSADLFDRLNDRVFKARKVQASDETYLLNLVEVKRHATQTVPDGFRAPFSLLFSAQADSTLGGDEAYRFENSELPSFEAFAAVIAVPTPAGPSLMLEICFG